MAKPYFGGTLEIELENESEPVVPWNEIARLREDLDELSDDALIGLVKGGSADAYAVLFARYRHPAHRLAAYYSNSVDAKDIVAESFAQVYDQLRRGRGPETSFRGYLLTAVRREAGRRAKMQKRATPTDDIATMDRAVPFDNGAVDGFERDLIQKAFASLPQRWQKVLWHLDVDGRKPRDVAPILGMKPNSVSALAYRAREGLRKAYLEQHILSKGDSITGACEDIRRRLVGFVRASATKSDVTAVESHLESCPTCTSACHELEELNSHIGAVSGVLAFSFAVPAVAGPMGGAAGSAAGGVAGHLGGLTAKATILGKTVAAAAGSTAAAMITSMTVVNIPLQLPAEAATAHARPFAAGAQREPDRTIGPVADGTLGRSVESTSSSTSSATETTGPDQDQTGGSETSPGQGGEGQTPGTGPSQGSSSGGSQPATVTVNGTKTSASVSVVGVKASASVDLKKPLEARVTVTAGNLDIDTDKVTKKVTNKVTEKVTDKVAKNVDDTVKKLVDKSDDD